jgi:hypothetical protein
MFGHELPGRSQGEYRSSQRGGCLLSRARMRQMPQQTPGPNAAKA